MESILDFFKKSPGPAKKFSILCLFLTGLASGLIFNCPQAFSGAITAPPLSGNLLLNSPASDYVVIGWNDLGMHCMDHDFSVFSILPPYNNLNAQLINRKTGKLAGSGFNLYYQATPDPDGNINTTSWKKIDFWNWAFPLFGVNLKNDIGLTGNPVQSQKPAPMAYDSIAKGWKAEGIPTVPYDDNGYANYYPMVKVTAKISGFTLASTKNVLPISDEINCSHCHTSGIGDPMAQPSPDWVYDPNPDRDWRRNILLLHDNRNQLNPLYTTALASNSFDSAGLLATSDSGNPMLCADCHASNALGKTGVAGVKQLTTAVHTWHGQKAMDDNTGMPLDMTLDRTACYYCHPGSTTQCLRGVMGAAINKDTGNLLLECQSCHGIMSKVGTDGRAGWKDLPSCQNCHYRSDQSGAYIRDTSAFDLFDNFRTATSIFSTGSGLYKLSSTHGGVHCEACHGSTHAEYPSAEPNDNVQSIMLQGYQGTLRECSTCHPKTMALTKNGGPHGLHTVGKLWACFHFKDAIGDPQYCKTCHGADYKGTFLSKVSTKRTFYTARLKTITYATGQTVSCYDCHTKLWGIAQ